MAYLRNNFNLSSEKGKKDTKNQCLYIAKIFSREKQETNFVYKVRQNMMHY